MIWNESSFPMKCVLRSLNTRVIRRETHSFPYIALVNERSHLHVILRTKTKRIRTIFEPIAISNLLHIIIEQTSPYRIFKYASKILTLLLLWEIVFSWFCVRKETHVRNMYVCVCVCVCEFFKDWKYASVDFLWLHFANKNCALFTHSSKKILKLQTKF